jgi:SAM-dependent methyltransferase
LKDYSFPHDILTKERLERSLAPERLALIRDAIRKGRLVSEELSFQYICPWDEDKFVENSSLDLVYSQAVLEHVDKLEETFHALAKWLKPGGTMSHVIGLNDHGLTRFWNGHWALTELAWRILRGKRFYLINREPLATHLRMVGEAGMTLTHVQREITKRRGIPRWALASRFRGMSQEDFQTSAALIHVQKD